MGFDLPKEAFVSLSLTWNILCFKYSKGGDCVYLL